MHRWYKALMISLIVLGSIFIRESYTYGLEYYYLNNKTEKKESVINLNDEEIMLLSKLVAGEARGESYEGQVAVAAVVINRVKDSRFPNTLEGVIYQKNAFSVVKMVELMHSQLVQHIELLKKPYMEMIQLIMPYIFGIQIYQHVVG